MAKIPLESSNWMVIFSAAGAKCQLTCLFLFINFFNVNGSFHNSKQQKSLNESDPRPKLR